MATRQTIRDRVRIELADPGPAYLWSDDLLNQYIWEALDKLSDAFGLRQSLNLTTVAGLRQYVLAKELNPRGIIAVYCPEGQPIEPGNANLYTSSGGNLVQCWELNEQANALLLRYVPTAGQSLIIHYIGRFEIPDTDSKILDVAIPDEALLLWLVCERCVVWLNNQRDKRGLVGNKVVQTGYYAGLYSEAIQIRAKTRGIRSSYVVLGG